MKYWFRRIVSICLLLVLVCVPVYGASYTEGIDVSSYNNVIDWSSVKSQGMKFVMIRTGEGLYTGVDDSDSQFVANYNGAGQVGLKRGVYHVACHRTVADAVKEAEYCLKIIGGRKLEYPVAYDIESAGMFSTGKENVTAMAKAFCDTIRNAGYTPMIYSSTYYLNNYFDWSQLKNVKVWVAEYGVSKPSFKGTYHMWQYSSRGNVAGAGTDQGFCDLNVAYLEAKKVTLSTDAKTLGIKETLDLSVKVTPSQSWNKVKYTSSNSSVAEVSSTGTVTGKKAGKAVITVTAGKASATCTITVKRPSGVTLSKNKITLKVGDTYKIKPVISNKVYCYKYTYSSSRQKVATVNAKGRITANKKGTTVITVKTFNGKTAKLKVIVK